MGKSVFHNISTFDIVLSNVLKKEFKQKGSLEVDVLPKKMNKKNISKLKAMFDHKDGVSQRQAVRKFKYSVSFVNKTLKMKTKINKN
jgi:hypothetical protein